MTIQQPLILNIDDTPSSRYAKTRVLKQAGYRVVEATTGAEALQALKDETPNLVLCDVNLPDMSGIEVCRAIKADPATRAIPVVQTSATFVTPHDQLVGLEGGAEIYLTEPLEALELTTVVKVLLRLHSTERGLVQSEARWRSFVESNIIGVVICRGDRIIEANDCFLKLIGYEPSDLRSPGLTWQRHHRPREPRAQPDRREGPVQSRATSRRSRRNTSARTARAPGRWSARRRFPIRRIAGWRSSWTSAIASTPRSSAKPPMSASTRPARRPKRRRA